MSKGGNEEVVIACLEPLFNGMSEISLDSDLLELGMDSMNFIRLVVNLEEQFDIEIKDEDITLANFSSVNSILNIVENYLHEEGEL